MSYLDAFIGDTNDEIFDEIDKVEKDIDNTGNATNDAAI